MKVKIQEYNHDGEDDFEILTEKRACEIEDAIITKHLDRENYEFIIETLDKTIKKLEALKYETIKALEREREYERTLDI